ncbi:deferrochelatase/peroxidase EfeB, partial [Streptomyces inhibens]
MTHDDGKITAGETAAQNTTAEDTAKETSAKDTNGRAPSRRSLLGWGGAGLALGAVAAGGTAAALRVGSDA